LAETPSLPLTPEIFIGFSLSQKARTLILALLIMMMMMMLAFRIPAIYARKRILNDHLM